MRNQLPALHDSDILILCTYLSDSLTIMLQCLCIILGISTPQRRNTQYRNIGSVNLKQSFIILFTGIHGGVSMLIGSQCDNQLVKMNTHIHQGVLVIYISTDSLIHNIIVQLPVGSAHICMEGTKGTKALGNGIPQPEHLLPLFCRSILSVDFCIFQ